MDHNLYASPIVVLPYSPTEEGDADIWDQHIPRVEDRIADTISELHDGPRRRYLAYDEVWTKCHRRIRDIVQETHSQITDDLLEFLNEAYIPNPEILLPCTEIPTALVVGDSNLISTVFDAMQHRLKSTRTTRASPFITIQLNTKELSTVLGAMRALISGFISQNPSVRRYMTQLLGDNIQTDTKIITQTLHAIFENLQSNDVPPKKRPSTVSLANHDMTLLQSWYDHIDGPSTSSGTRLVVFIASIELCDSDVLKDVIHICSLHVPHIPLVFVFGTTTSSSAMHSTLPLASRSKLYVESFQLQRGLGTFESIIRGLFLDDEFDLGLMLTPAAHEALKQSYTRHEQSLDSFISTLQLTLMSHFEAPYSVFSYQDMLGEDRLALKTLRHPDSAGFLAVLRSDVEDAITELPESPASVEAAKNRKPGRPLDPKILLAYVALARVEFSERHNLFKIGLRLLRRIALEVRSHAAEMRAGLSSLLGSALRETVMEEEVQAMADKIRTLPLDRLQKLANAVAKFCNNDVSDYLKHLVQPLAEVASEWDADLQSLAESTETAPISPAKAVFSKKPAYALPTQTHPPGVVKAADNIASVLETYFQRALAPMTDVPLSDIWHMHFTANVAEQLNPAPRYSIVRTLGSVYTLLGADALDSEDLHTLPDTAVLFRRYLDSGRTINAYDWFESFAQAMSGERDAHDEEDDGMDVDGEDREGKSEEKWRREIQARFLRSIHELDWNGLLKSTRRKRDHVARTLFDPPPAE